MDRNVDPDADTLTDDVVALRKESVDRNFNIRYTTSTRPRSLSARRAWIEIRNGGILSALVCCRSPQGERG